MAIVDCDLMMTMPKGLTSASGIDVLTHAMEAYVSMMATDYTDSLAVKAARNVFAYLPRCYDDGAHDPRGKGKDGQRLHNGRYGVRKRIPGRLPLHGSQAGRIPSSASRPVANALMLNEVIRFNSAEAPVKMGTFPQYDHPHTLRRYAEFAEELGIKGKDDSEKVENLIKAIEELKKKIGIKASIKEYGIDEKDFLDRLDEMCVQDALSQSTGANPRYPLISEIKEMYLNAYYGR